MVKLRSMTTINVIYEGSRPKKKGFIWESFPKCVNPPQGYCEIWENERWNSGKNDDFRGDFFRGLGLVWESATPPTHIWESFPE